MSVIGWWIVSRFFQEEVHYPAAANMVGRLATMLKDGRVIATGFFKGVRQDGQFFEPAFFVNGPGDLAQGAVIPSKERRD